MVPALHDNVAGYSFALLEDFLFSLARFHVQVFACSYNKIEDNVYTVCVYSSVSGYVCRSVGNLRGWGQGVGMGCQGVGVGGSV